jgi:hypothetical protein
VFTQKSSAFALKASELSELLTKFYGKEVSIAHFERMLSELPSLNSEQKGQLFLPKVVMDIYDDYASARTARETERRGFRSQTNVENIAAGVEAAKAFAVSVPTSPRSEAEEKGKN